MKNSKIAGTAMAILPALAMNATNIQEIHKSEIAKEGKSSKQTKLEQTLKERPNVVFVFADDMGYGDIKALNPDARFDTPNISQLAQNGITFTDAHAIASVSTPSRYGFMTGQYAFRTAIKRGALNGWSPSCLRPGQRTIGNLFKANGYTTACVGKWHLGWDWPFIGDPADHNVDYTKEVSNGLVEKGFDYSFCLPASLDMPPYVFVENGIPTTRPNRIEKSRYGNELFREGPMGADLTPETCLPILRKKTLDYIDSRKGNDEPFFLYVPVTAPHTPILPEDKFKGKSDLNVYGDFVMMVDDFVGQVYDALEKAGVAENTIVIFSSDNGPGWPPTMYSCMFNGHRETAHLRGRKFDLYEGGHRMPLVISWGNHYQNQKCDDLISLTDLYATFAEMFDYELANNEAEDSESFWKVLEGTGHAKRNSMVYQSGEGQLALRQGDWKILFTPHSGGHSFPHRDFDKNYISKQPPVQLFNLKDDPCEGHNVAKQHPRRVKRMTRDMYKIIVSGRSTPGKPVPENYKGPWGYVQYIFDNGK